MARVSPETVLRGPVHATLLRMAGPNLLGIASLILFGVVDTIWVGQLGAPELAAMGFTFPVTFVITSLAIGMGIGTMSVVSRAIGRGDRAAVRHLATHSLGLANGVVVVVAMLGFFTIEPLFTALGAQPDTIALIRRYIVPWYLGVGFLVIPMVGNACIRATGDTRTPSVIMMVAGLVNVVLDPLLIFGVGPFPRLELRGAALATVASWVVVFVAALWVLGRREKILDLRWVGGSVILDSWRRILWVGAPAAASMMLMPVAAGVITRILAQFGNEAVAAFGAAGRVESLAMVGVTAVSMALAPFVGQNSGAKNHPRVRAAVRFAIWIAVVWGAALAVILAVAGRPIASLFNDEIAVVELIVVYLGLLPVGYGAYGVTLLVNSALNGINRPMHAALLGVLRLFVFSIPLAYVFGLHFGVFGVFCGMLAGNLLGAGAAGALAWRVIFRPA